MTCDRCLSAVSGQSSTFVALLSIVVGGAAGVALRYNGEWVEQQEDLVWLAMPGQLFMRLLQCLSMPVVLPKLVSSLGTMEVSLSGLKFEK